MNARRKLLIVSQEDAAGLQVSYGLKEIYCTAEHDVDTREYIYDALHAFRFGVDRQGPLQTFHRLIARKNDGDPPPCDRLAYDECMTWVQEVERAEDEHMV